jgi:drug/metabolite transporter (DMT)-like permease
MNRLSERAGWLAVVSGTLLFSTSGIVIRYIHLPPIAIVFLTQAVTASVLVIWQWRALRRIYPTLKRDQGSLYRLLALGVLRAVDQLAFTTAVWLAPVAKVLIVAYLFPINTMVLAHWFLDERTTARSVTAALIALAGIVVLVLPELGPASAGNLPGLLLAGVVSLAVAINRVLIKGVSPSIPTPAIMSVESLLGFLTVAPFAAPTVSFSFPSQVAVLIVFSGVAHGIVAHMLILTGLRVVPAGPAAVVGYLEPIAASLLAWWLLSEPLSQYIVAGGILTLVGSLVVVLSQASGAARALSRDRHSRRRQQP